MQVEPGLSLPLSRLRPSLDIGLTGTAYYRPSELGVLAAFDKLALLSPDLNIVRWQRDVPATSSGLVIFNDRFLYGPYNPNSSTDREVAEIELATGELVRVVPVARGLIVGTTEDSLLLSSLDDEPQLICIDRWSLGERWRRPTHADVGIVSSANGHYLVPGRWRVSLDCIDAGDGRILWSFEPPGNDPSIKPLDRGNRIPRGLPSVAIAGDRVVITTAAQNVYVLTLEQGEVIGTGRPPFGGKYVVCDTSIFFAQPFGLSEFDYRDMREVDRVEYRNEVEPLYRGKRPTMNALCLTMESVIWTTMHGALMGVSRRPASGMRRSVWLDEIEGALMPIGLAPTVFRGYLYYSVGSTSVHAAGLYGYRSVAGHAS